MRFGCGARLLMDHIGEICEACVKAGLGSYNRTVGSADPKRVPRHAESTSCPRLPHESIDQVKPISSHSHLPGVTSGTEHTDEDLKLLYPEDAAEIAENTSSEARVPADMPAAKEDAGMELDLVYPDDVNNVVTKPPPNKPSSVVRTKRSSSALFEQRESRQATIPSLGARADDAVSPASASAITERWCETSGCDEVLPRNSSWKRCVKCTMKHWKQLKHAAFEARNKASLSSLQAWKTKDTPGANCQAVTSRPREADGVKLATLSASGRDQMSEEKEPSGSDEPSPSSSPSNHGIHDALCSIPGWDSDPTDLSSEDGDKGETEIEREPEKRSLKIRIPLLVNRQPPDSSLRKCAYKRCNIALSQDYRWKTCEPCRRFQRAYQRARHDNKHRRLDLHRDVNTTSEDHGLRRRSPTPTPSELDVDDTELIPENSRPCAIRYCRRLIPLPEVYRWKSCKKCRARARHEARRKKEALYAVKSPNEEHEPDASSPYPAYQHSGALISSFNTRLEHFVETQILYLRAKLHSTGRSSLHKLSPMMFSFGGEYSTIVGHRGTSGSRPPRPDMGVMRHEVDAVLQELQGVLRTMFKLSEAFAINTGGILMRFTCSLELIAPLRPLPFYSLKQDSSSDANALKYDRDSPPSHIPLVKPMSGDLEVAIVPDNTHRLFIGQRAIIRFRMLG
ncbi:hypothetical protein F5I97DRAFT_1050631 [Phlebopus sp. FC_14]|nr:hypothetical protein F5I97DRAFT_1050631 [Phlebopus sp. FC_14]